ncbi:MAG: hypothetical protein JXN64_14550 [Spirochaetes bacterium]|nr:hypothetical protein [Spirochaetota bacterium]
MFLTRRNNFCIAIKTSAGDSLGTGHMQRMTSLLWFLNECKSIKTYLISDTIPDSFPSELRKHYNADFDFQPDIIIRDMRDSAEDEIARLQKIAPVFVVDDNGPGRNAAHHAIDILPNPDACNGKFNSSIFLYGYNFLSALDGLKDKIIKKELDFAIYPGNAASKEYMDFLISLLPEKSNYAMLNGRDSYVNKEGKTYSIKESLYAETILSSKTVISHFGITLYEALIAYCRIISINPTPYHSLLADMAKDYLHLINLGEHVNLNPEGARMLITKTAQTALCSELNAADVRLKIMDGLKNFCEMLFSLI